MTENGTSGVGPWTAHWRTILMVIVAAMGVSVIAAVILTVGRANSARDRALTLQSHSYEVMILARSLSGTMAHAEATLGRFVISGDRHLGQQYFDEWLTAGQQLDRLDYLVSAGTVQQRRVDALRRAYAERGDELAVIALSIRYKQNNQALSRFWQASNTRSLARIGSLLNSFIANERILLNRRSAAADQTIAGSNRATKLLVTLGVSIVLGAIVLGWMTVRAQTDRAIAAAEVEAERQRAGELEVAVATATEELQVEVHEREVAETQLRQVQKLDALGRLTGGIAHDFNNMLAVVIGGIELARRRLNDGSGDVDRHLASAVEGANRASALTRQLLAFARSEPLLPQSTVVGHLVDGMSDLLDRTLGDAIRVDVNDHSEGWHVWVDRHRLENAILNLAVNARDAMNGRGALSITIGHATLAANAIGESKAGDYATIAVRDTGSGMTPEVIERVFEPFFTTKPVGKGTGLGLSQIFGFVRESGGEIAIQSAPHQGTTVTLYLPRHFGVAAIPAAPRPVGAPLPAYSSAALDILVVEDDPRVLAATMGTLAELGHRAVACNDPLAAIATARALPALDLVISDVLMPGKTGPELIAELTEVLPDVAVLFVTGFAGDAAEHGSFEAAAVLRKPFTIAALSAAIDSAVSGDGRNVSPRRAANG